MSKKKTVVVVTRKLPETIETRMMELFDVRLNLSDEPMTQQELIQAVKMADVFGIERVWAAIYEGSRQHGDFGSKTSN